VQTAVIGFGVGTAVGLGVVAVKGKDGQTVRDEKFLKETSDWLQQLASE
jgi:hypothetical protein